MIDELLLKVKNRNLVVILVPAILGLFIGTAVVARPAFKKIQAVDKEKKDLSQKAGVLNNIQSWEKKLEIYKNKLAPGEKPQFIDKMNTLASQSGLSVTSISPDEKKPAGDGFEYVPIRIDAEGNYHQLGEFVSRVENLSQTAKIMSVEISAGGSFDDADFGSLTPGAAPFRSGRASSRAYKMSATVGFFSTIKEGP